MWKDDVWQCSACKEIRPIDCFVVTAKEGCLLCEKCFEDICSDMDKEGV